MKGGHPIASRLARLLLTVALAGPWARRRRSLFRADPAAAVEQAPSAGRNPAGPAGLESALAAVRDRIAGLPARPCGLRAPWNDYLQIFEDSIAALDGATEGPEATRAARGIEDLDRLVTAYEFMNDEACSLYDRNLGERQRLERIRERVRAGLAEAVADIRGNAFPSPRRTRSSALSTDRGTPGPCPATRTGGPRARCSSRGTAAPPTGPPGSSCGLARRCATGW